MSGAARSSRWGEEEHGSKSITNRNYMIRIRKECNKILIDNDGEANIAYRKRAAEKR